MVKAGEARRVLVVAQGAAEEATMVAITGALAAALAGSKGGRTNGAGGRSAWDGSSTSSR